MSYSDRSATGEDFSPVAPQAWHEIWWYAITNPYLVHYNRILEVTEVSVTRAYQWFACGIILPMVLVGILIGAIVSSWWGGFGAMTAILIALILGLMLLINLIITVSITNQLAKTLGGEGRFQELFFLFAAYKIPLMWIEGISLIIFPIAIILSQFLILYDNILGTIATKAAYPNLTWRKAAASYLLVFYGGHAMLMTLYICLYIFVVLAVTGQVPGYEGWDIFTTPQPTYPPLWGP